MLKLIIHAEDEDSSRDLIQDNPTNQEKANILAQIEIIKVQIVDSFNDDWEVQQ